LKKLQVIGYKLQVSGLTLFECLIAAPFEKVTGKLSSVRPGLGRWAEKPAQAA